MQEKISEEIRLTTFPFQNKIMYSCELIGYFKDGGDNVREKTLVKKGYKSKFSVLKFADKALGELNDS